MSAPRSSAFKGRARRALLRAARALGLFALARRHTAGRLRILGYHGIWTGPGHFGNFLFMNAETFSRRLDYLSRHHYQVLPLDRALAQLADGRLPAGATAITIDDGWYGTYREMVPLLKAHGFPATIYLTSYYSLNQRPVIDVMVQYWAAVADCRRAPSIELSGTDLPPLDMRTEASREASRETVMNHLRALPGDRERQALVQELYRRSGLDYSGLEKARVFHLMSAEEVGEVAAGGIDVELHTHRHRTRRNGQDCLEQELSENRRHLARLTGRAGTHFCYPSGEFKPEHWGVLERCGIRSATTTVPGLVDRHSQPYALPRILDGENVSDIEFAAEMSGFLQVKRDLVSLMRRLFPRHRNPAGAVGQARPS